MAVRRNPAFRIEANSIVLEDQRNRARLLLEYDADLACLCVLENVRQAFLNYPV